MVEEPWIALFFNLRKTEDTGMNKIYGYCRVSGKDQNEDVKYANSSDMFL